MENMVVLNLKHFLQNSYDSKTDNHKVKPT